IVTPFFHRRGHILWHWALEVHFLLCRGMNKAERVRMQCMPRQYFENIFDELPVFRKVHAFQNLFTLVSFIVEKGMTDMFKMRTYLVSPACFELTFYPGHVFKTFNNLVMRHRMLTGAAVLIYRHLQTVFRVTATISGNCTFIICHIPPYKCPV